MHYGLKNTMHCRLEAKDGLLGRAKDFLFDDRSWCAKYLVAGTGRVLPGRRVLVPTPLLDPPDLERRRLPIDLARDGLRACPGEATDEPLYLQVQHGAPDGGWTAFLMYNEVYLPGQVAFRARHPDGGEERERPAGDPHLRSARFLLGTDVLARGGPIGRVDDFLIEARSWRLGYLVVATGARHADQRRVLIATDWVESLGRLYGTVSISVPKDEVESAPAFYPETRFDRAAERELFSFYGKLPYWEKTGESGPACGNWPVSARVNPHACKPPAPPQSGPHA